jgi:putative FmdB family regulatory protein
MPLYEYICKDCGNHFDALRSMKDADASISCIHCHSNRTVRQLSVFYASSGGKTIAGTNSGSGCGSCSGGSCASCGH